MHGPYRLEQVLSGSILQQVPLGPGIDGVKDVFIGVVGSQLLGFWGLWSLLSAGIYVGVTWIVDRFRAPPDGS